MSHYKGPSLGHDLQLKTNMLYERASKKLGGKISNKTVARGIYEKTGVQISPSMLSKIRTGYSTNISVTILRAIAEYFQVPASFLIDSDRSEIKDNQVRTVEAMVAERIALRCENLSIDALEAVERIVTEMDSRSPQQTID